MSRNSPEHDIQVDLINELNCRIRQDVVRFAIPNGGLRHLRVAQKLKAEGVLPGMPDLGFAVENGRIHWIEMKAGRGSTSDNQDGVLAKLGRLGHNWAVAKSVDEAIAHLKEWGVLKR